MTSKIKKLIADLEKQKELLENAILAEIASEAKKAGIDKLIITAYSTTAKLSNGEEVEVPEIISKLDELFSDYVNACGFEAIWSNDTGWG